MCASRTANALAPLAAAGPEESAEHIRKVLAGLTTADEVVRATVGDAE